MRLRPEWDSQLGILITWPHPHSAWRDSLSDINQCYQEIAWQISRFEPLHILCYDALLRDEIHHRLTNIGIPEQQLHFYIVPTNDTWIRDYGPLRINQSNATSYLDFQFNAWGSKFPYDLDNSATTALFQYPPFSSTQRSSIHFILEGGSIDVNGLGSLLTTTSCLLNPNRNPNYNKQQIESLLIHELGVNEIIWIDCDGLAGDDTDGHIDTLARFCNNDTIIYNDNRLHKQKQQSGNNKLFDSLRVYNDSRSTPLTLVGCPVPKPAISNNALTTKNPIHQGSALPASYTNFLIINDAVLVPTYEDTHDQEALSIFSQLFPQRNVIGINCIPLIQQYGSLHCATMQF